MSKKVSDLMRVGARQLPQIVGSACLLDSKNKVVAVCALGAAAVSYAESLDHDAVVEAFTAIQKMLPASMRIRVISMNDKLGYSIERIADELEKEGL